MDQVDDEIKKAGVVTHTEAREILSRFNASHWFRCLPPRFEDRVTIDKAKAVELVLERVGDGWKNDGRDVARYSIPADPRRDDDLRLSAYITANEQRDARLADEIVAASKPLADHKAKAVAVRDAWEEWLKTPDQFVSADMLNAIDALCDACGAPAKDG